MRWCWVNFQCRDVLLIWIRARADCACSMCGWKLFGHFFSHLSFLLSFSLSPLSGRRPDRHRLKCCLKRLLSPKQPTNQIYIGVGRGGQPSPILLEGLAAYPLGPQNISPTFSINVYVKQYKLDHKCTNLIYAPFILFEGILGGGRVVRWCWVNFQCRGVLQF